MQQMEKNVFKKTLLNLSKIIWNLNHKHTQSSLAGLNTHLGGYGQEDGVPSSLKPQSRDP